MSGQASDWLDVGRLALELRLANAAGDVPEDIAPLLTSHILAAVDWVSHESGLPLVDQPRVLYPASPSGPDSPIFLGRFLPITRIERVDFWPDDDRAPEPTPLVRMDLGSMQATADHGRLASRPRPGGRLADWSLYPPPADAALGNAQRERPPSPNASLVPVAGGWPTGEGSAYRITIVQGLDPALYPALSQACVLMARQFFEGAVVEEKVTAARRLYERYTVEADET